MHARTNARTRTPAGTTTTCESLFMGVPCISLVGGGHAHNVGASLLAAVGLDKVGPRVWWGSWCAGVRVRARVRVRDVAQAGATAVWPRQPAVRPARGLVRCLTIRVRACATTGTTPYIKHA